MVENKFNIWIFAECGNCLIYCEYWPQ